MSELSWWRSWHGAPMDHKWPVIAARSGVKVGIVSAIAWALMDYASQQKNRGSVIGFDVETYSIYSGWSEDEINAVLKAMIDKGVITDGRLTNWEKRQPKSERDIERVTEWRAQHKAEDVTPSYDMLRNITQDREEIKIKDKDTEKEEDREGARSFDAMRQLIERKTGNLIMPNENEISAINEMVKIGIIESDIDDAIVFFRDNSRIARGALSLLPSVKTAMAKRVQQSAKSSGRNGRGETSAEQVARVARERDERIRNGQ